MRHSIFARSGGSALGRALFMVSNLNTEIFNDMQYIDLPLPKANIRCIMKSNACSILGG